MKKKKANHSLRKILSKHVSDQGIVSRIHNELSKLIKNTNTQLKNGQNT